MADNLKTVSRNLTALLGEQAAALEKIGFWAKALNAFGAAVVAVATFQDWKPVGEAAALFLIITSIVIAIADRSNSKALTRAQEAVETAVDLQAEAETAIRKFRETEELYSAGIERISQFQAARDLVRAILEDVTLSKSALDEVVVIDLMLKQAARSLFIALGFKLNEFYTICVYQRVKDEHTGNIELVCRAHIRAIECDISLARRWKLGIGAAGVALARGDEVVIPDLKAKDLGTLYNLTDKKREDDSRYGSIVAEPIGVDGNKELWGILVATSSVPYHFSVEDRSYVDITQSLAGMIGLAIKIVRCKAGSSSKSHT